MSLRGTSIRVMAIVALMGLVGGCSGKAGSAKLPVVGNPGVVPVKGIVQIDGQPAAGVWVQMINTSNPEKVPAEPVSRASRPDLQAMVNSGAITDKDGKFNAMTHKAGDGVPEGDYVVAFFWDGGADTPEGADAPAVNRRGRAFNEKYQASKSEIKFTAKKGEPKDLGVIDLKTK